jgi:hypothetical protein
VAHPSKKGIESEREGERKKERERERSIENHLSVIPPCIHIFRIFRSNVQD